MPPNWSLIPPADITTVRSLKFDFGSRLLTAGETVELIWPMQVPVDVATNGVIAWNSFGIIGTRNDNNALLLAAEPIKVGIATNAPAGAQLWQPRLE